MMNWLIRLIMTGKIYFGVIEIFNFNIEVFNYNNIGVFVYVIVMDI